MNRFWIAGASLLALSVATPALATAVVSATLVQNDLSFSGKPMTVPVFSPNAPVINVSGGDNYGNGIVFDAESRISANEIYFKNSIIGSGRTTSMVATIGVAVTITNNFDFAFRPELRTKILAAGMGLFFATPLISAQSGDTGQPLPLTSLDCTANQLKNCSVADASQLNVEGSQEVLFSGTSAGFVFDVAVDGTSVKRLASSLGYDDAGVYFEDIADAQTLAGFTSTTGENPDSFLASAYAWEDTFIDIAFPDMLLAGSSVTAVYTISTYINLGGLNAPALYLTTHPDGRPLVVTRQPGAFAAFGDPIGNNSSIDDFSAAESFGALSALSALSAASIGPTRFNTNGTGVFTLPTISVDPVTQTGKVLLDGQTLFLARDETPYGAIPEPSVWAMLIMGFGFVGAALRRTPVLRRQ